MEFFANQPSVIMHAFLSPRLPNPDPGPGRYVEAGNNWRGGRCARAERGLDDGAVRRALRSRTTLVTILPANLSVGDAIAGKHTCWKRKRK